MSQKERYLEEYEKYKMVDIYLGLWRLKSNNYIEYEIVSIVPEKEQVSLRNVRTENSLVKTLHWCRKNLIPKEKENE